MPESFDVNPAFVLLVFLAIFWTQNRKLSIKLSPSYGDHLPEEEILSI